MGQFDFVKHKIVMIVNIDNEHHRVENFEVECRLVEANKRLLKAGLATEAELHVLRGKLSDAIWAMQNDNGESE